MVPINFLSCSVKITKLFHWVVEFFKKEIHKVLELKDTQHAVAGGVAIGMFFGFTPLFGLKTLLSMGFAWLFGVNIIAAIVAVSLHDIIVPLWPFILRFEFQIGFWLMHHHLAPPINLKAHHITLTEIIYIFYHPLSSRWWVTFTKIGLPLCLGSLVLGLPSAFISYGITLGILTSRQRARHKVDERDIKQD